MDEFYRGPTIAELARKAGVGTATVDRVINKRGTVRASTREKVLAALQGFRDGDYGLAEQPVRPWRIAFLSDSGLSYNQILSEAIASADAADHRFSSTIDTIGTHEMDPVRFAQLIERRAGEADGLVIVARENLTVNRALRSVADRGIPFICLTTDLPNSSRTAYVGNDQTSAGEAAAYLMGKLVGPASGKILLVVSAPYRVQEERELGFRRILRSEFAHLEIDDSVNSHDSTDFSYRHVSDYIRLHGAPVGVYNVAGGNLGIAKALEDHGVAHKTIFIGHELNPNSRMLLESGHMHIVIGHDVRREVELAVDQLLAFIEKRTPKETTPTQVLLHTKYNCR